MTSLLTPGSLVAVVMHLLVESGEEVRTKVLKIVARKLEEGNKYFSSEQVKQNITFLWSVAAMKSRCTIICRIYEAIIFQSHCMTISINIFLG